MPIGFVIIGYLVMGLLTCEMRSHISHVHDYETFTVTLVFWLWPVWFVWVLPVWLHEHAIGRITSKTF